MIISNMFHNKVKHSHVLIIIIVWSLFQCVVNSTTSTFVRIPTFLAKQPVAKADKQIKCIDKDQNALLDFKVGLEDPYNYISDWGTKKEDDCCTWTRVTCDNQTGHVTELDLSDCYLEGSQFIGSISDDIQHFSSLQKLYLDDNQLNGTISKKMWGLPSLFELRITSNSLGGATFENIGMSSIEFINISSNNFSEKAPDISNFNASAVLDLSSNNFYGPITNVSSSLNLLNLSKNKFYGGISFLCQIVDGLLVYLDLSHNLFSGQIPDCLWQLKALQFLNLANNNLFGKLPASFKYLNLLDVLDLYNNNFSGELPLSLKNCTNLTFLDLGANKFSGNMSVWIGENLLGLYALSLGSNNLFGPIPLEFCQLVNLQILDLSMNNLNGTIPSCVNNLTSMVQQGLITLEHNRHHYGLSSTPSGLSDYVDSAIVQWQGIRREFTNNLGFLKSIDLSHNNLAGKIPNTLTDLRGLLALNLSRNALHGEIPKKIGKMKDLLMLDLSRNQLSGEVPSSISEMFLLSSLDVSYNNLSGRIPSGTQLQSFENSSYTGNAGLCGPPISKYCPGDERFQMPSIIGDESEGHIDQLERWFYIGGAIGFAIGFWLVCSALLISHRGRHTFFHFMDRSENWVHVKVVVFVCHNVF
uniref:receptor-like protein EIX2 isoform X1 n=1 Tax=Erigeron canadensis TaxID=72917 RepID=UPI001CB9BF63|nr:receptor-like protein EIX2 isoform X1 [Erigeron canadensis]